MAEAKYDLLLVNTKKDDVIRNQPWWKERLRTKYIKSLGPGDTSKFLQGQNWTFLKDGLDDFRDGLPPATEDGVVIMGHKGLAPNIQGSSDSDTPVKQPAVRNRFSKHEICYSRVTPQQQQRRDHINEIEYGLTQHPLALYPHLEECMPPDVFEDVVDILDPEMNIASEAGEDSLLQEEDEDGYREETPPRVPTNNEQAEDEGSQDGEHRIKNPYRWWPRKEEKDRKDKKKAAERRASSPSQDEHIKGVTKEFCDWVASLGGESNNIEESTITSLFASGYETKPALSVPIHVVELTNVPPELRMSAAVPPAQQNQQTAMGADDQKKNWVHSGSYEPSWVKFKYGAWYLQPKTWKKRMQGEPLKDPKEIKDHEMSEAKKKSNAMDNELAAMHGSQAFMDFIDKKDSRRPEFLEKVSSIKDEKLREEVARRERDSPHAVRHPKTKIIISSARSGRT